MLTLYKRHIAACQKRNGIKKDDRSFRRCNCIILFEGTLAKDGFVRGSTKATTWEAAKEWAALREKAGVVDLNQLPPELDPRDPEPDPVPTVEAAVDAYIQRKETTGRSEATIYKDRVIFERQLLAFCKTKGIVYITALKAQDISDWRDTWKLGSLAKSKRQSSVIGFLYFCARRGWIPLTRPAEIADFLGEIIVTRIPTGYFEPHEYQAVLNATYLYNDKAHQNGDALQGDGGKRIRALVELMRWTGLRIGDAVTLKRELLYHSNGLDYVIVGQNKLNGQPVCCAIPPDVAETLRTCPQGPKPNLRYFFWSGNGKRKSVVTDWQRSLKRLFNMADLRLPDGTPKRAHPHMLRDTFAVESLLAGQDIKDVSVLLGHQSVLTTEKSYLPWVRARQMAMSDKQQKLWAVQGRGVPTRRPGRPRKADVVPISKLG